MICKACALHKEGCSTNNMKGRGRFGGILLLGEAPGEQEDEQGKPFVGPAGDILRGALADTGMDKYPIWITNTVRCRPADNRKPKIEEIRTCREKHLDREIKAVHPKMIVSLGAVPSQAITDCHTSSVAKLRGTTGKYTPANSKSSYPTFFMNHPAAVLYDRRIKQYLLEDLKKAKEWYEKGCPDVETKDTYSILPLEEISKSNQKDIIAAVDLETEGYDPYSGGKIYSIAVTVSKQATFYKLGPWHVGSPEWMEVLDLLRSIGTFVFHNGPYDLSWMTRKIPKDHWIWNREFRDSMIALQFRDEHYNNTSLAHLTPIYTNTQKLETPVFVKEGFPKGWDCSGNRVILERYNCRDAYATYLLEPAITFHFGNERVQDAYEWVCSQIPSVVRMRHSGIHLSQKRLEKLHLLMSKKIRVLERKLSSFRVDFTSRLDLIKYLYTTLRLPVLKKTKTGAPCCDADTLKELEPLDKSGFLKTEMQRRQFAKIRDTYCNQMKKWGSSIAHPRVFLAQLTEGGEDFGTNTGRPTTEGFVNLPRGDEPGSVYREIKKVMTSRYGKNGVIVSCDGAQMEMRVLASLSGDKRLMEACEQDIHRYVASKIYRKQMKDVDPDERQNAKHTGFTLIYGGGAKKIAWRANKYRKADQPKMSVAEAEGLQKTFFSRFPDAAAWIQNQQDTAMKEKLILSPIGRPYHLDNALNYWSKDVRKSTNSPIQGGAGDFNTEAGRQLQQYIIRNNHKAHVILFVYDQIVSDWHKDSWDKIDPEYLKKEVLTKMVKERFKLLGWDIQVPIEWDLKVGHSLGEVE